mmetsp:Transcript_73430/g.175046  ORF Transcript_73430/g.175046 Transcript_73430/m.175046 type:complete len:252 (-) Transcript_73430:1903-2658(-)
MGEGRWNRGLLQHRTAFKRPLIVLLVLASSRANVAIRHMVVHAVVVVLVSQVFAVPVELLVLATVAAMHVVVAGGRMVINAHVVLLGLESIAAVKVPQLVVGLRTSAGFHVLVAGGGVVGKTLVSIRNELNTVVDVSAGGPLEGVAVGAADHIHLLAMGVEVETSGIIPAPQELAVKIPLLVVAAVAGVHVDPRGGGVIIQARAISAGLDMNFLAAEVPPLVAGFVAVAVHVSCCAIFVPVHAGVLIVGLE